MKIRLLTIGVPWLSLMLGSTGLLACSGRAGPTEDAGQGSDASVKVDGGNLPDAGEQTDAGDPDADAGVDGGETPDDGGLPDAGADAGMDAGTDAGLVDAGTDDGGVFGLDMRPANPACIAPPRPVVASGVQVVRAFPNLGFAHPAYLGQAPGDNARIWVVERAGRVVTFPNVNTAVASQIQVVVDISSKVNISGEGGLLGLAFHPDWANRKELFLSYTRTGPSSSTPLVSVVSRFRSNDNGVTFTAASEEVLLELNQPYDNHNGGGIEFGPDGFLYIGFGDGGGGGDPLNSGQRTNTNLAKMIRIDVNVPAAQRYAIPPSNPFAQTGAPCNLNSAAHTSTTTTHCAEIYATGLRNPWRFSFDSATGELWVGDVGQEGYEEVDRVVLGGNYGWRIREGAHCYAASTCNTANLIDPVVEYAHDQGTSITGGYVYRGTKLPGLVGRFIYGDFSSGRIWAVTQDPSSGAYSGTQLADTNLSIGSFGTTLDGEVYVLSLFNGEIHKLEPMGTPPPDTFPKKLTATGCFDPTDATKPLPSLVPYDLNAPLWSDGAGKERYFAIPDGQTITVGTDGDWSFPTGTVLVKTFYLGGKRIETRLFMRHPDGQWGGYSYEWDAAQTDADLLPSSKSVTVGSQTWSFPSRAQCMSCHTAIAGRVLGLETAQLNRDFLYPTGRSRNQLQTLDGIGFFTAPLGATPQMLPRLEAPLGSGPLADRARAYLHSNCSNCHRQGAGQGPQDFRYNLTLSQMNACDVLPANGELGIANARIIAPGAPSRSIASVRMHVTNAYRMPPLASSVVDTAGVAVVDQWIGSLTGCTP